MTPYLPGVGLQRLGGVQLQFHVLSCVRRLCLQALDLLVQLAGFVQQTSVRRARGQCLLGIKHVLIYTGKGKHIDFIYRTYIIHSFSPL